MPTGLRTGLPKTEGSGKNVFFAGQLNHRGGSRTDSLERLRAGMGGETGTGGGKNSRKACLGLEWGEREGPGNFRGEVERSGRSKG